MVEAPTCVCVSSHRQASKLANRKNDDESGEKSMLSPTCQLRELLLGYRASFIDKSCSESKKKTRFSTSAKWLIIDSGVSESQALAVSHSDILFLGRSERGPPGGIISASCFLQVSRDEKKLYTDRRANTIKARQDRRQSRCFSFLSARNKTLITGKPTKYSLFLAHF